MGDESFLLYEVIIMLSYAQVKFIRGKVEQVEKPKREYITKKSVKIKAWVPTKRCIKIVVDIILEAGTASRELVINASGFTPSTISAVVKHLFNMGALEKIPVDKCVSYKMLKEVEL